MADSDPTEPFFLIVADLDAGLFCVGGPMNDDRQRRRAAQRAKEKRNRHIQTGLFNAQYMTRMARIALMPPKAMRL